MAEHGIDSPASPRELLSNIISAQRSDGTWRAIRPLSVISPRARVYSGPEDLCFALFEQAASLLSTGTLTPDDFLAEATLAAINRFIGWAEQTHHSPDVRIRSAGESALAEGWSSSAEPDAAFPECWATAIVLRVTKAFLHAVESASERAVTDVFRAKSPSGPARSWDELTMNSRVRKALGGRLLRSALLAGPPGTGKTTLVQSLATQYEPPAPLITISPDYLTAHGVDKLSSRLEHVFLLLPLLKRGIVFFDEIDELLLERDGVAEESFSRLLTTAMLPHLQNLHDICERGRELRFFVATNHVEKFDTAIIRQGRFDRVLAVELPDAVARSEHTVRAFAEKLLKSTTARATLFFHARGLVSELLGPVLPARREWRETAEKLYSYCGTHTALADAACLLIAEATCARRNATYKLYRASRALQSSADPALPPIVQTRQGIALLEDATYFHLVSLLAVSFGSQAIRYAHSHTPLGVALQDAFVVAREVNEVWCRITLPRTDGERATLARSFSALRRMLRACQARLKETPGAFASASDDARAQARRLGDRRRRDAQRGRVGLKMCADLLATTLEQFNFHFQGRRQIEPFAPKERAHEEMLARRAPGPPGSTLPAWMQSREGRALETYLGSEEARGLATKALEAAEHQKCIRGCVERLVGEFEKLVPPTAEATGEEDVSRPDNPVRSDVSADSTESNAVANIQRIVGRLVGQLDISEAPRRQCLPTAANRAALQSAVSELAQQLRAWNPAEAKVLQGLQLELRSVMGEHFKRFVWPLARRVKDAALDLVAHAKSVKEIVRANPTVYPGIDYEKVEKNVKDAVAAYKPWWEALSGANRILDDTCREGALFGQGTIRLSSCAVRVERPELLQAEYATRGISHNGDECWQPLLEPLHAQTPEVRASVLATLNSEIELIGAPGVCLGTTIGHIVWRSTALAELLERVVEEVLSDTWKDSDKALATKVPFGLPSSGQALRVGEGFSRTEIEDAAKAAATHLGLLEGTRLATMLGDLENGLGDKVERELRTALREAFAHASRGAKYYSDAAEYEWKLKMRKVPIEHSQDLHPRFRTPFLPRAAEAALRRHTLLWALRVDAEHDPQDE